jgi:hypothetical protein
MFGVRSQYGSLVKVEVSRWQPAPVEDELEDEFGENSSGSAAPEAQKRPILSGFCAGGAEGGRTPDLLIANEELVATTGGGNVLA